MAISLCRRIEDNFYTVEALILNRAVSNLLRLARFPAHGVSRGLRTALRMLALRKRATMPTSREGTKT